MRTNQGSTSERSSDVAAFVSEATPFMLEDMELSAVHQGASLRGFDTGIEPPLARSQAQTFVLPKDQADMAVITVTTFKPELSGTVP